MGARHIVCHLLNPLQVGMASISTKMRELKIAGSKRRGDKEVDRWRRGHKHQFTNLALGMAMLGPALLVEDLGELVEGLLLLAEILAQPQIVVPCDDLDVGVLGVCAPQEVAQEIAALSGGSVAIILGELDDLDLG